MKRILTSILCLLVFSTSLLSQNEIYQEIKKQEISDNLKVYKIDSLLLSNLDQKKIKAHNAVSVRYSNWLYKRGLYSKALQIITTSIELDHPDSKNDQMKYYVAGNISQALNKWKLSNNYYQESIKINEKNKFAAHAYLQIANNYYNIGEFSLSIKYFEIANVSYKNQGHYKNVINVAINSYKSYKEIYDSNGYHKLRKSLFTADSLSKTIKTSPGRKQLIKKLIGRSYYLDETNKDTLNGQIALLESLDLARQINDSSLIEGAYSNLGVLFSGYNTSKSIAYLEKALEFTKQERELFKTYHYANIGKNKALLGDFKEAIQFLEKSISIITQNKQQLTKLNDAKKREVFTEKFLKNENTWSILSYLAETYLLEYKTSNDPNSLKNAISYFKLTDELLDYYNLNITEIASKLSWRKDATEMYGRALKACYLAQDHQNAFFFLEKNKALLLTEEVEKQRRKQSFNFPQNVYTKELNLKKQISYLEKEQEIDSKKLVALKEKLKTYWDSIQKNYPTYIPLKAIPIVSLKEVQNQLKENELVIQFHISVDKGYGIYTNENNGYVLVISPSEILFEEINDLNKLKNAVSTISEEFKKTFDTQADSNNFKKISFELYDQLFPSKKLKDIIKDKKITIIPDNYLSAIPFEALSTSIETLEYLIKKTEISYAYSTSFLRSNTNKEKTKNRKLLSLAPVEFGKFNLARLSQSKNEIAQLENYFNGTSFIGANASKQHFLDNLPKYGLIHLATHADAKDGASPWIAFSDEKLYLEDLYLTTNNANLVVLSGCNTTLGEQVTGEGVMSLARGFFHSGAQSVVSSLWSIDDKATAQITSDFYKNLKEGKTKSNALHLAKLKYLNTHSLSEISPNYWASFILLGENDTIKTTSVWCWFLYIGLLLIVILVLLKAFKRNTN